MPRFKFLAFTNPVEGQEDESIVVYEYSLAGFLHVPGLLSAQRFRLTKSQKKDGRTRGSTSRYMTVMLTTQSK